MDTNTIITELLLEFPDLARQILTARICGYTSELLDTGDTIILDSEEVIIATIGKIA